MFFFQFILYYIKHGIPFKLYDQKMTFFNIYFIMVHLVSHRNFVMRKLFFSLELRYTWCNIGFILSENFLFIIYTTIGYTMCCQKIMRQVGTLCHFLFFQFFHLFFGSIFCQDSEDVFIFGQCFDLPGATKLLLNLIFCKNHID